MNNLHNKRLTYERYFIAAGHTNMRNNKSTLQAHKFLYRIHAIPIRWLALSLPTSKRSLIDSIEAESRPALIWRNALKDRCCVFNSYVFENGPHLHSKTMNAQVWFSLHFHNENEKYKATPKCSKHKSAASQKIDEFAPRCNDDTTLNM